MNRKYLRSALALAINWLWAILIIGTFLTQGTAITMEQAAVLVAGLASSVFIGWLTVRKEGPIEEPSEAEVLQTLKTTEDRLLQIIASEDEDVVATVKAIFLLASKAAQARYSVLEAAEVIGERIEEVAGENREA